MSGYIYQVPGTGRLMRVSFDRLGRRSFTDLPTKTLKCDACGWTTQAIDDSSPVLERCICGGTLRVTTAIKEATKEATGSGNEILGARIRRVK